MIKKGVQIFSFFRKKKCARALTKNISNIWLYRVKMGILRMCFDKFSVSTPVWL